MELTIEALHFSDVDLASWPWKNFTPSEVASHGDGSLLISIDAMDRLQWIRTEAGRPVRLNSAFRDPIYNALVGGAPMSQHKAGKAFDIRIGGFDRFVLLDLATRAGFSGFGFYQSFLHVDTGRGRQWAGGKIARKLWNI